MGEAQEGMEVQEEAANKNVLSLIKLKIAFAFYISTITNYSPISLKMIILTFVYLAQT